ncbi:MAG: arylesterase [Blastomonas sp.]|uniref:arylesterase n=1 Tax=Blastomonas sp. TaxID=1909299 RepID=UPI002585FCAD|nr:arylesterase [Blastomonas sp.]MCO5792780.1 arylesterase [Blastomonas sp.]
MALVYCTAACSASSDEAAPSPVESAEAPATPAALAADTRLVMAFGDSLYAGYGVKQDESFPAQLEKALSAKGLKVSVRNAGVSGDTTAAGLQRLAFALDGLPRKPDLVILGLGGNDMLRGISPDQTRSNLDAMLKELEKRDIDVVMTGMIAPPNLGQDYAGQFNPIFSTLAQQYDAELYPFFLDGVITDPKLMLPDGIHPNPQGIARVVNQISDMVAAELKD